MGLHWNKLFAARFNNKLVSGMNKTILADDVGKTWLFLVDINLYTNFSRNWGRLDLCIKGQTRKAKRRRTFLDLKKKFAYSLKKWL